MRRSSVSGPRSDGFLERAIENVDIMTAQWARLPYELLDHLSRRIVNKVAGISGVLYDISGKPPATFEWE